MPAARRLARPRQWLLLLIAFVATLGQLTVALAPLAEGRDGRLASHVEASGATGHVAHNESKCISCQARSILGAPGRPATPPIQLAVSAGAEMVRGDVAFSSASHLQSSPRAPPVLS